MVLPFSFDPVADASQLVNAETVRQTNYVLFENYYNGKHTKQLPATDQRQLASLNAYTDFKANICDVIVDSAAERLMLSSMLVNDDADNEQARKLMKWWQLDRCDHTAKTVHTNAMMKGDSYVIVDWDDKLKRPKFVYNPAYLIQLYYKDVANSVMDYATKTWPEPKDGIIIQYRYYPDHIERYYVTATKNQLNSPFQNVLPGLYLAKWQPYTLDGLDALIPWTDAQGEPLGIAVIPFKNQAHGAVYGRSELANVVPLQDAINKTVVDMLLSMDVSAWRILIIKGNAPKGGWVVSPGKALQSNDPNFTVDALPASDINAFMQALEFFTNLCFGRSRTPKYFTQIEGSLPSGEAIKAAQEGFISKIRDRQEDFGDSWEDCFKLACRLDNARNKGTWDVDNLILQAQWVDPENRLALHWAQAISTLAPWLSHRQILRLQGYGEEEIDQIVSEQDEDKSKEDAVGASQIDQFNKGLMPGDPGTSPPLTIPAPGHQAANRNPERQPK